MWRKLRLSFSKWPILATFLLLAWFSTWRAIDAEKASHDFWRLFLAVMFAMVFAQILKKKLIKLDFILALVVILGLAQSIIGLTQFIKQSDVGLQFLGEPALLGPDVLGAAKIAVKNENILRAYGTFPHPSILSAFLILSLIALSHFWLKLKNKIHHILAGGASMVILAGLVVAFSRTGWIIAVLATLALLWRRWEILASLGAIALVLFLIFTPYIVTRLKVDVEEPAISLRAAYNSIGWEIMKSNKFGFGVGIGNQVNYAVANGLYQSRGLNQEWQYQPIHNIYILIASEMGVLGLVAFGLFLFRLLIFNFQFSIFKTMLLSLLLFGLADHFLWTQREGILMLWLTIGILIGLSSAHGSMDRAQASEA